MLVILNIIGACLDFLEDSFDNFKIVTGEKLALVGIINFIILLLVSVFKFLDLPTVVSIQEATAGVVIASCLVFSNAASKELVNKVKKKIRRDGSYGRQSTECISDD